MNLEIEDIKALDPNKVYLVYVNCEILSLEILQFQIEILLEQAKEYDIKFIILDKDTMEVLSPKESNITVSSGK